MDKNIGISFILGFVVATGIIVPTFYFLNIQSRVDTGPIVIALAMMQETPSPPLINIKVNGSAVPVEFNLTLEDFEQHSYLARYIVVMEKRWGGAADLLNYTEFWVGIPFTHLIYDIANVTSYTNITLIPSDNPIWAKTYNQTDIDNATFADDIMLAYKRDGHYLTSQEIVRSVFTKEFSLAVFGTNFNGFNTVRLVETIEIT